MRNRNRHERVPLYLVDAFDDTLSSSSFLSSREGEEGSWNRTVETHSNKTFQYIDGLNPYTVYLFRVAAENALGYSKPGKESYPTLTLRERKLVIPSVANYFLVFYREVTKVGNTAFKTANEIGNRGSNICLSFGPISVKKLISAFANSFITFFYFQVPKI